MNRLLILFCTVFLLALTQGCVYIDSNDDTCTSTSDCAGDDQCVSGKCTGKYKDRRSGDSGSDSDSDDVPECQRDSDCGPGLICDDFECEDP